MITMTVSLRPRCGHEEFNAHCVHCASLLVSANKLIKFIDELKTSHGTIEQYHNTWSYKERDEGQKGRQP